MLWRNTDGRSRKNIQSRIGGQNIATTSIAYQRLSWDSTGQSRMTGTTSKMESAKKSGVKLPGADIAAQLGIGETTVYRILALHRAQRL